MCVRVWERERVPVFWGVPVTIFAFLAETGVTADAVTWALFLDSGFWDWKQKKKITKINIQKVKPTRKIHQTTAEIQRKKSKNSEATSTRPKKKLNKQIPS